MLKRIYKIFILFPLSIYLVIFAVYNHQLVEIDFFPLLTDEKSYSLALPFYITIYITLVMGIILGGFAAWVRQSRYRSQARIGAKDARHWRLEAERLSRERDQNIQSGPEKFYKIHQKTVA